MAQKGQILTAAPGAKNPPLPKHGFSAQALTLPHLIRLGLFWVGSISMSEKRKLRLRG